MPVRKLAERSHVQLHLTSRISGVTQFSHSPSQRNAALLDQPRRPKLDARVTFNAPLSRAPAIGLP